MDADETVAPFIARCNVAAVYILNIVSMYDRYMFWFSHNLGDWDYKQVAMDGDC